MSKGNTFENDLLLLIFNATTIANIAINATSSPLTNLEVSLHTADPGEAGDQTTSEIAYTSYARVPIARTSSGWTVTTNTAANAVAVTFPACTGSSGTATYVGVGTAHTSTGKLLYSGAITTPGAGLAISTGITPAFAIGALTFSED